MVQYVIPGSLGQMVQYVIPGRLAVLLVPIQHRKQTYGSPFDRTELILIPIKQRIEIYGSPFGRTELILLPIQRKEIYGSPFGRTELMLVPTAKRNLQVTSWSYRAHTKHTYTQHTSTSPENDGWPKQAHEDTTKTHLVNFFRSV